MLAYHHTTTEVAMSNELMRKDCSVHRASGETDEITRRVVVEQDDRGQLLEVRIEEDSAGSLGWDTIDSWSPRGREVNRYEH